MIYHTIITSFFLNKTQINRMNFKFKKIFSQITHTAIVLPLLFSMLFSSPLYASDTLQQLISQSPLIPPSASSTSALAINPLASQEPSIFQKSYNAVYRFVADTNHEYLLAPLTAAVAAGTLCGPWCAAGGVALGAIDEISMYFGITSKRYLTWGTFAATTGYMIHPSMASGMAGAAIGILLPAGTLNDHNELITPLVSTVMTGSPMGALPSIIDELLISAEIADKHYMTSMVAGENIATKLLGGFNLNPTISSFIGVLLGSVIANNEEEISTRLTTSISETKKIRDIYGKFIPPAQVDNIIEKQTLALASSYLALRILDLKADGYKQILSHSFEHLDNIMGPAWGQYLSGLGNFAIFIFPCFVAQTVSDSVNRHFNKELQYSLEDKMKPELFSDAVLSRLSHDPQAKVLINTLDKDIKIISQEGSGLITETVSSLSSGVYGIGVLIVSSPNLLVYSALYKQAQLFISNILWKQSSYYSNQIVVLESQRTSVINRYTDPKNIKTIVAMGGDSGSTQEELQKIHEGLRECEESRAFWQRISSKWWQISHTADSVIKQALIGHDIRRGNIPFANKGGVNIAAQQASGFFSILGRTEHISSIEPAVQRITALEEKIHKPSDNIDRISRTTKEGNQLILQNLEAGIGKRTLVKIDDLRLNMGKTYVLTGSSGCGKSLLMSKINKVTTNGVRGTGNIYYPLIGGQQPTIAMVTQEKYFPANSSLQQVLAWPNKVPTDTELNNKQKEEMRLLIEEMKLWPPEEATNDLSLDSVRNWDAILSPGQQRKIMLASAIIKKPDILILDEVFDSLDPDIVSVIQQTLKKYLPNALILSVDQHAKANNYNHFYDKELRFANKTITMQDLIE